VGLTFDDGPDPVWTARLLAELELHQATATFFPIAGRAVANRALVEAMVEAGHEVGFHCLEHRRHSELSDAEIGADAAAGLALLGSIGVRPALWRTPWGLVTAATRRVAAEHGLEICGWNADSHDWRGDSCEEMLAALDAEGGVGAGSVVLMHDGIGPGALRSGCAQTVRLAGALAARARSAGLATTTASALFSGATP
jgi:peptidoglycan/xylan/chitin deacetylase (PgdA/CDA1 family)